MSQIGPFPDAAPKPVAMPTALAGGPTQMEYLRAFNYIFENPNWIMNLVWAFLASLAAQVIPILPQLVFMGYQFELIETLHATRGARYPDFDINRFTEYLSRSIWPFLVALIVFMVLVPIMMVLGFGLFFGSIAIGAAGGDDAGPIFIVLGLLLTFVVMMLVGALFSIVSTPMILRAGLSQDFAAGFDLAWTRDFMSRMWLETLLSGLFVFFSMFGLILVTCGLAAIVLGPMMPFVSSHLWYQLYALYLSRGGTPVPLKPQMPPPGGYFAPPPQY